MSDKIYITVGRRKTSIARVRLTQGSGKITINNRTLENYFPRGYHQYSVLQPLKAIDSEESYDIMVNLKGGGLTGQAGALRHGISRALILVDPSNRPTLKKNGFLTRDSRMIERKKYGHKSARKSFQFSKR